MSLTITNKKTQTTRLMDLLAGWAEFVENEEGKFDDPVTSDLIGDLYSEAAEIASRDYTDAEAERDAIGIFVSERLLPVLLK